MSFIFVSEMEKFVCGGLGVYACSSVKGVRGFGVVYLGIDSVVR